MDFGGNGTGAVTRQAVPDNQESVGAQLPGQSAKELYEPSLVCVGVGAHGKIKLDSLPKGRD